jgi:competence protein ComGC
VAGSLTVLLFLTQTVVAVFTKKMDPFGFWSWIAAGQTAAWRLKWVSIPLLIVTVWLGRKLYRSIKMNQEKFCGLKHARRGLFASSFVVFLIALLIGVTVPERLRQRQRAKDAAHQAYYHRFERAVLEYQVRYKTLPADLKDLQARIPDPYGELAEALKHIHPAGYRPSADFAAVAGQKSTSLRGVAIRKTSMSSATDDTPSGGLAFTTYELQIPGEDGILGTEDDWVAENGILKRVIDVSKGGVGRSVSAGILQP